MVLITLEAAFLAMSVSIDAFAAAFAYGCKKIKIPFKSIHIINFICTGIIGLSFLFGNMLMQILPEWLAAGLSFTILFLIGITKLLDSITKAIIKKYTNLNKEINLSLFNFKFILHMYANPEAADADISKSISPREAAALAVALSLDGFAVGLGAAFAGVNGLAVILFTFITGMIMLLLGGWLGNKTACKLRINLSWAAGLILIWLAFMNLV